MINLLDSTHFCKKINKTKTLTDEIVVHVSMAHPTSNGLMNACEEAIKKENIEYQKGGTLCCYGAGPQFSTLCRIKVYIDHGKQM